MIVLAGTAVLIFSGCGQAQGTTAGGASSLRVVEKAEGFVVLEGQQKVLFYRRKAARFAGTVSASPDVFAHRTLDGLLESLDEDARTHYIHPLYGLDGEVLTEDFPFDHLHHHGIWWAWHQVLIGDKSVGDGWEMTDVAWDVDSVEIVKAEADSAVLKAKVFWKSPKWTDGAGRPKPFIEETAVIGVHRSEGDIRKIDFEIALLGLAEGVRIGGSDNKKGYGGFSARFRFPKGGLTFTGADGAVKPKNTAVEAGPWLDFSGDFRADGGAGGVAILCHKSIPGYPRPWILRRRESMQNAVFPGREPVTLSTEKPTVLRYRLIVHRGRLQRQQLDRLLAEYNGG